MKKICVYSRNEIQNMLEPPTEPHLIVSINCPDEGPAKIRTNNATLGRASLFFWDLDQLPKAGSFVFNGKEMIPAEEVKEEHLVKVSDAKAIIDLVEAHPEWETLLVHCTAGISRSSAVAAALHKIFNGSDEAIFGKRCFRPNMRVYRMVLEEWHSRQPQE